MPKELKTYQLQLYGVMVQVAVYESPRGNGNKPFRAIAHHGSEQLAYSDAATSNEAEKTCKALCVQKLNSNRRPTL